MLINGKSISVESAFTVPAQLEKVIDQIRDVEEFFTELNKVRPNFPPVKISVKVVDRYLDGSPRQVRGRIAMLGLTDDVTSIYEWREREAVMTTTDSRLFDSQKVKYYFSEGSGETRVVMKCEAELKSRLPSLVMRQFSNASVRELKYIRQVLDKGARSG